MAKKKELEENLEQRGISENEESEEKILQEAIESESLLFTEDNLQIPLSESENDLPTEKETNVYDKTNVQKQTEIQEETHILSINVRDNITLEKDESAWYEIVNAYRNQVLLSGVIVEIERKDNGNTIAIVSFKGQRVAIPVSMMNISDIEEDIPAEEKEGRRNRIITLMLGAKIDFIVKGIDIRTKSCVASRKSAMQRKIRNYFINNDTFLGKPLVHEGRIVEARIVTVYGKSIRIEVFGVETTILAEDLSHEWIATVGNDYSVGDNILVKINKIEINSIDNIIIEAEAKSLFEEDLIDKIKELKLQGRYIGKIVDKRKGLNYVKIENGLSILSGSTIDYREAGIGDLVSCIITNIDMEKKLVYGIISRIIKQNI